MSTEIPATTEVACIEAARWRGRLLIVDPPDVASLHAILEHRAGEPGETVVQHASLARAEAARTALPGLAVMHQAFADEVAAYDTALVYLPKSKPRIDAVLASTARALRPDGSLLLVGTKKQGIGSMRKRLEACVGEAEKLLSARHCMLFEASVTPDVGAGLLPQLHRWDAEVPGGSVALASLPGVFANGRLDDGTAMLLRHLPTYAERALDLGCGSGIVGAFLAQREPTIEVLSVDDDAVAVASATATAGALGLSERMRVVASDGYSAVRGRFSLIASNPPFHDGVATTDVTAERFIAEAGPYLTQAGQLVVVGNRFLRYPAWFDAAFKRWEVLEEDGRYRVIRAFGRDAWTR